MIPAMTDMYVHHAEPANPTHGIHALLECREPAIDATKTGTVMRAPGIVLGLGVLAHADETDAN